MTSDSHLSRLQGEGSPGAPARPFVPGRASDRPVSQGGVSGLPRPFRIGSVSREPSIALHAVAEVDKVEVVEGVASGLVEDAVRSTDDVVTASTEGVLALDEAIEDAGDSILEPTTTSDADAPFTLDEGTEESFESIVESAPVGEAAFPLDMGVGHAVDSVVESGGVEIEESFATEGATEGRSDSILEPSPSFVEGVAAPAEIVDEPPASVEPAESSSEAVATLDEAVEEDSRAMDESPEAEPAPPSAESAPEAAFAPLVSWDPLADVVWRADQEAPEVDSGPEPVGADVRGEDVSNDHVVTTASAAADTDHAAPGDAEFAEKLSRIAAAIRAGQAEELLAANPQDALTALVVGYYLGTIRR